MNKLVQQSTDNHCLLHFVQKDLWLASLITVLIFTNHDFFDWCDQWNIQQTQSSTKTMTTWRIWITTSKRRIKRTEANEMATMAITDFVKNVKCERCLVATIRNTRENGGQLAKRCHAEWFVLFVNRSINKYYYVGRWRKKCFFGACDHFDPRGAYTFKLGEC